MRTNKIGKYKISKTLGEGSFAKVKRRDSLLYNSIFYSWRTRAHQAKSSCKNPA